MFESNGARVSPLAYHNKKANLTSIIRKSPLVSQSQKYKGLTQAIHKRELTKILYILEARGITSDLAIFILANLQNLGVAA